MHVAHMKMSRKQCKHIHGHQAKKPIWMHNFFFFFLNSLSCLALDTEMLKLVGSISVSRDLGGNGQNIEGNE